MGCTPRSQAAGHVHTPQKVKTDLAASSHGAAELLALPTREACLPQVAGAGMQLSVGAQVWLPAPAVQAKLKWSLQAPA